MDLLLVLTYTAFCIVIFKVFKIPLNKWTVPTALLGGIILIGALLLIMNYNHPYGKYGKDIFASVPIVSVVKGLVIAVEVVPNQPVQKDDVLFRIDPLPYELAVLRKSAELSDTGQGVLEQEEAWKTARAQVNRARADRDRAKQTFERYAAASVAFSQQQIDSREQLYIASEAMLEATQAQEKQAKLQMDTQYEGENARVVQIRAELRQAQWELDNTVVRAPADGLVTQLALRPGVMAVTFPLRPALVFIPEERRRFAGSFWQNSMGLIKPGQEAEVIIDAVPGHVFKGEVVKLLPAMAEGELQSAGTLVSANLLAQHGRAMAVIELKEDLDDYNLPHGAQGKVAIYTESFSHVAIIRRVLLRMLGWLNYVYPIK